MNKTPAGKLIKVCKWANGYVITAFYGDFKININFPSYAINMPTAGLWGVHEIMRGQTNMIVDFLQRKLSAR